MRQLIDRMRVLEHRVHEAGSLTEREFPGGVAYYNSELPLVWDVNFVRVDHPAVDLAAAVDELQDGMGHRKILIEDPALVEAHSPELIGQGYGRRDLVALAREPGGRLDRDVRELPYEDVKPFRFDVHMEQLAPPRSDVADQVGRVHDRTYPVTGERWFVINVDGKPAGHLIVYPGDDGLAQIEDVGVLQCFRGHGLARRLIEHALQAIADDGHDIVFITAETNDWPHEFYRRLGFDHVEDRADFLLIKAD
ncbi:MAG TPA: GNAT family N-acetyltransferase [Thermoleophilaceae bacterium]|nr:GNAT family N-acetyltransferase [Thermoleophilaceae bacterium]